MFLLDPFAAPAFVGVLVVCLLRSYSLQRKIDSSRCFLCPKSVCFARGRDVSSKAFPTWRATAKSVVK